jgi:IS5 family transposase
LGDADTSLRRSSLSRRLSASARKEDLFAARAECIGKGQAHRPYEFGVKVSLATTLNRSKGGQFIAHAKALPGIP